MSLKQSKSRSMVLKKGKVIDRFWFSISGAIIPSILEQPVKSLGKCFDSSRRDTTAIQKATEELGGRLIKVDQLNLLGRFKAWIYQHSILPRVLWSLLVVDVSLDWLYQLVLMAIFFMTAATTLAYSKGAGPLAPKTLTISTRMPWWTSVDFPFRMSPHRD